MANHHAPSLAELEAARDIVYRHMPATPQFSWPLLCARTGAEVWVKHENHTPTGAFKVRGGVVYLEHLLNKSPDLKGVVTPTRGNHGQSVGFAARAYGVRSIVVVPKGNSPEKNAAMRAFGVTLIEHGDDFQDAYEHAQHLAESENLHFWPTWHPALVQGVASYSLELFAAVPHLDVVYVPIGQGSGISGMIQARDALGLDIEIVGVVSEHFPAYAQSFAAGHQINTGPSHTIADGVACRTPDPGAVAVILGGADRIVTVSESEITDAMRAYFTDTHNVAEGAGALPLAALLKEDRDKVRGRTSGLILSGGNVDAATMASILSSAST